MCLEWHRGCKRNQLPELLFLVLHMCFKNCFDIVKDACLLTYYI